MEWRSFAMNSRENREGGTGEGGEGGQRATEGGLRGAMAQGWRPPRRKERGGQGEWKGRANLPPRGRRTRESAPIATLPRPPFPHPPPPPPPPAPPPRPLCSCRLTTRESASHPYHPPTTYTADSDALLTGNVSFRAAQLAIYERLGVRERRGKSTTTTHESDRRRRIRRKKREKILARERCGRTAGQKKEGRRAVGWQRDREIKREGRVSQDAPPATDCTLFCALTLSRYLGGVAWSSSLRGYIPTVPPLPPLPPPPTTPTPTPPSARHPFRRAWRSAASHHGRRNDGDDDDDDDNDDDDDDRTPIAVTTTTAATTTSAVHDDSNFGRRHARRRIHTRVSLFPHARLTLTARAETQTEKRWRKGSGERGSPGGGRGRGVSKKEEEVREDDDEGDNGDDDDDDDDDDGGAPAVEGERRHIRRELLRWTKNMVFVVENTLVVETCCEPKRRILADYVPGVTPTRACTFNRVVPRCRKIR
ncbi:hypothetical protein ALC62_08591 [Cyphomyrmex costatus]|uniref:Uncharacterized protein n=1 Tax=Cyphomyrmex costatus TaxID=456900 RepID=A0A151IGR0_9HYME|nr:hypothetical protein ALC62_08591 [Cyphomyrmex costatus]